MDLVLLVAILFVALFLGSSLGHLTQSKAMGATRSKGLLPVLPQVSGVLILSRISRYYSALWGDLGSLFLVVFLIRTALSCMGSGRRQAHGQADGDGQFSKDVALRAARSCSSGPSCRTRA